MNRRRFLTNLLSAPAVITTPGLLMPVKAWVGPVLGNPDFLTFDAGCFPNAPSTVVRFVNCSFSGNVSHVVAVARGGPGSAHAPRP